MRQINLLADMAWIDVLMSPPGHPKAKPEGASQ